MSIGTNDLSLAIELSSRRGAVALGRGDQLLGEEAVIQESRSSDDLIPAIERLFHRCGTDRRSLRDVIVSIGPGGFTGLRIATTTAKMLALSMGARIVAVPTASAVVEGIDIDGRRPGDRVAVVLGSKRGRAWVSVFEVNPDGLWRPLDEGRLATPEQALQDQERALRMMVVEHAAEFVESAQSAGVPVATAAFSAANLLRVGRRNAGAGAFVEPGRLAPLYAREPEAVRLWDTRRTRIDADKARHDSSARRSD